MIKNKKQNRKKAKNNPDTKRHVALNYSLKQRGHPTVASDYYQRNLTTRPEQMGRRFMPFTARYSFNGEPPRGAAPLIRLARR